MKADLERALGEVVLDRSLCGQAVQRVAGLGTRPKLVASRAASHGEPVV